MAVLARHRVELITMFGGPVRQFRGEDQDGISAIPPAGDMDLVRQTLTACNDGGRGMLRLYRPRPTAAFSPRDTTLASYSDMSTAMANIGFTAVERRAGGQLAVYDENALIIDLVAPHRDPREDVIARFRHFSAALSGALQLLSIPAAVGSLPGEYCPGDYSIHGAGRIKLVGVAQRIVRCGYHLGAVISVQPSPAAQAAVAEAYRIMGADFDPRTFGAITDLAPEVSFDELRLSILAALAAMIEIEGA